MDYSSLIETAMDKMNEKSDDSGDDSVSAALKRKRDKMAEDRGITNSDEDPDNINSIGKV